MSVKDRKEEAEAVLDSAEMLLETYGGTGDAAVELKEKVAELEQELENPDSERSIKKLIDRIKELMQDIQEQPVEEPVMGPEDEMGSGLGPEPDDDVPPF